MSQPIFYYKNVADYSNSIITTIASEANDLAPRVRNRSNLTSWITTGSVDANNTTFEVDFGQPETIDTLILVKHNFKSFLVEYYDGFSWVAMPTPINPTNCVDTTSFYSFALTHMEKIRITIAGTQVPDSDKQLYQFIATSTIGQFVGYPVISNVKHDQNRQITKMLSGRSNVNKSLGGFSCDMTVNVWKIASDIAIAEALFNATDGFLVSLCGGNESQFSMRVKGYRLEDIYLCQCANDYSPNFYNGIYNSGLNNLKIGLIEVDQ